MSPNDELLKRLREYCRSIPLTNAMQVEIDDYTGQSLRLHAPLAPNINDKGSAFGGSLTSLLTLAGWSLVVLRLAQENLSAEVYVADSTIRYLAPLYDVLQAEAQLAEGESWDAFLTMFRQRGKARCRIVARIALPNGGDATTLEGRFVALSKPSPSDAARQTMKEVRNA
ncbi:MAG: thioesterase domain-containing protein [Xanthomonadaceae bacterium]|jgi:thioesterase domain-containing protein|nr:thioesterase domain-containing protein [Xanthomonadaceae bacterium]